MDCAIAGLCSRRRVGFVITVNDNEMAEELGSEKSISMTLFSRQSQVIAAMGQFPDKIYITLGATHFIVWL